MFVRKNTIYDKEGFALWTTYDEDEAWMKVDLTKGQYIEADEWVDEYDLWNGIEG